MILVGNKIDLPKELRKVKKEKMEKFCDDNNIKGIEVSAKNGDNVENAFNMLTELIVGNMTKEEIIKKFGKNKKESYINISEPVKKEKRRRFC